MSNNWIKQGHTIAWNNSSGAEAVIDQFVQVGFDRVGVVTGKAPIAADDIGTVCVDGVFRVAKAAVAIVADEKIYIVLGIAGSAAATNVVSATNYFLGYAEADAASGDAYVNVRLAPFREEGPRYIISATTPLALGVGALLSGECHVEGTTNGAQTVTLPAIASVPVGTKFSVLNNGSANARTIDPNASEAIGVPGATSTTHATLDAVGDYAEFVSNGTAWYTGNTRIS